MRLHTSPVTRSRIALAAALALAAASACSSNKFSSAGSGAAAGAGGSAAGAAGSGGAASGGSGGVATGGTGGAAGGGAAGGAGGAAGGGGASSCGTCDGCCVGGSCVSAAQQSWSQCGANGATCSSCAYGVSCDSGSCSDALDPAALFHIVVDSVQVQPTDANGNSWDIAGGAPDPEVCFDDGQGTHGCTNYCSNQETCNYSVADGTVSNLGMPVAFSGASLASMTMVVYDNDATTINDRIGANKVQLQKYSAEYTDGPFEQVVSVSYHLVPGQ